MWNKAIWKGHPMRLELTRVGLLVELANYYTTRGAFLTDHLSWTSFINSWVSIWKSRNSEIILTCSLKCFSGLDYFLFYHIKPCVLQFNNFVVQFHLMMNYFHLIVTYTAPVLVKHFGSPSFLPEQYILPWYWCHFHN